ncbi:MAG TPA: colicin E3/pyocin S6 family cytotoxin [Alphaproteobacteria bacterium]
MAGKAIPKPSILDGFEYLGFKGGQKLWRSQDGRRYYTWDALHGEVEVFNKDGRHLGVVDPISGLGIKGAVRGRTIDV